MNRPQDIAILALTCWRENRSGGYEGMQSVANVVMNRVAARGSNIYTDCTRRLQFSSITYLSPVAIEWPLDNDQEWAFALNIATLADGMQLPDVTNGATSYYAPASMLPPGSVPSWVKEMTMTVEIEGQIFFK